MGKKAFDALTEKQRRFVEAYCGPAQGNATEAARRAGYAHPDPTGSQTLGKPRVQEAIRAMTADVRKRAVMTAEERQEWLTKVVHGEVMDVALVDGVPMESPAKLKDRLVASEQLSKMQGSYLERREVEHKGASVTFYVPDNGRDGAV